MTVFIDNAEFTQRLQRERDELLAENRSLLKLVAKIAETWNDEDMVRYGWLSPEYHDIALKMPVR